MAVRPVLLSLDRHSRSAEDLIIGTALVESGLRCLRTPSGGLGLFGIDLDGALAALRDQLGNAKTVEDDAFRRRFNRTVLPEDIKDFAATWHHVPDSQIAMRLATDLRFGAAICRLLYGAVADALPGDAPIDDLASVWAVRYGAGGGDPADFIWAWRELGGQQKG